MTCAPARFFGFALVLPAGCHPTPNAAQPSDLPPPEYETPRGYDLGGPKTGYHGYWAQDFLDIDPHWTSRRTLDGAREYEDSRDGRMQHYKDFVTLAHAHGLKVVQDIVCNHTLSPEHIEWFRAGGALNLIRAAQAGK